MSIKRHFVSCNPINGKLIEFDYKQLEIRVLALASGSVNLIEDLNNDRDMHAMRAAEIYGMPEGEVTKRQRRRAKGFSFQLQYGASAKSIAEYWNEPLHLVEKFFDAYFTRYPEIHTMHNEIRTIVGHLAGHGGDYVDGHPVKRSIIPSIWDRTGDTNGFFITESLGNGYTGGGGGHPARRTYFPPTKMKNYPIQGGAADILLLVLGRMRKLLHKWQHKAKILVQVHDSILFDWYHTDDTELYAFVKDIKDLMESVPEILNYMFHIQSPVEFPVDVTIGKTWQDRDTHITIPC